MELFFSNNIKNNIIILDSIESKHCIKVLRKTIGDKINIVDGLGTLYKGIVEQYSIKECHVRVVGKIDNYDKKILYTYSHLSN